MAGTLYDVVRDDGSTALLAAPESTARRVAARERGTVLAHLSGADGEASTDDTDAESVRR